MNLISLLRKDIKQASETSSAAPISSSGIEASSSSFCSKVIQKTKAKTEKVKVKAKAQTQKVKAKVETKTQKVKVKTKATAHKAKAKVETKVKKVSVAFLDTRTPTPNAQCAVLETEGSDDVDNGGSQVNIVESNTNGNNGSYSYVAAHLRDTESRPIYEFYESSLERERRVLLEKILADDPSVFAVDFTIMEKSTSSKTEKMIKIKSKVKDKFHNFKNKVGSKYHDKFDRTTVGTHSTSTGNIDTPIDSAPLGTPDENGSTEQPFDSPDNNSSPEQLDDSEEDNDGSTEQPFDSPDNNSSPEQLDDSEEDDDGYSEQSFSSMYVHNNERVDDTSSIQSITDDHITPVLLENVSPDNNVELTARVTPTKPSKRERFSKFTQRMEQKLKAGISKFFHKLLQIMSKLTSIFKLRKSTADTGSAKSECPVAQTALTSVLGGILSPALSTVNDYWKKISYEENKGREPTMFEKGKHRYYLFCKSGFKSKSSLQYKKNIILLPSLFYALRATKFLYGIIYAVLFLFFSLLANVT